MAKERRLQIVYHGTDEATAKKILKTGFKPGTFFALHLEDSIGFGGNYIFEVAMGSATLPKPDEKLGTDWEFIATDRVPPSQIVELKHYPKVKSIMENKALGEMVFRSNLTKPKPQPDIRVVASPTTLHESRLSTKPCILHMPANQPRISPGVGYTDKGAKRMSRRPHKGWRRVGFS